MVFFLIGVNKIQGNAKTSVDRVNTSLASNASLYEVKLETTKYKLGNFDNMMMNYEVVTKLESQVEGCIKRIQKAYLDVEPKADLEKMTVESKELGPTDIVTFVKNFNWDDSKYPRNQALADLLKIISQRISTVDSNLKNKVQAYADSKNAASSQGKKDQGSIFSRNLNELFATTKSIQPSDFVNTAHLQTMIAIVPEKEAPRWEKEYELLNDYIVPASSKELKTGSDIGPYRIYRFVLLKKVADDVIKESKEKLGVTVRDFVYDTSEILKREEQKQKMASQSTNDVESLRKTCVESFKDIYSTYIHVKVLKVVIDSQMRFGSPDDYILLMIKLQKGKEKRIHKGIIDVFADKSKKDFYGTKEELNDTEDFFPYAFANIDLP